MSSAKLITPTAPELNGAIKAALEKGVADWKEIHKTLVKEQPHWKLPERRVAKFVKRQKAGKPGDDDDSVAPSVRSRSSLRSWMKKRSSRRLDVQPENTPVAPPVNTASSPKQGQQALPFPTVKEEPEKAMKSEEKVEEKATDEAAHASEERVVVDERSVELRDEKCGLCEGCFIL
ncbi:hypothetical protein ACA910_020637 [Epithemia clementina (nom. ined.)]